MLIKLIESGTKEYNEMADLRKKILLDPYDIPHYYINPEKEKNDFLIGAFDEQVVGCCLLSKVDESTLQLRQMAVDSERQGSGVGAAIVAYAEKVAREHGFQKIILHARDTAKGFYEKFGYQIVGDEFLEVGLRHFNMEKEMEHDE